jgi:hypothetical protein
MPPVQCASCGEKGNVPDHLIGKKIRCQKCGTSFLVGAQAVAPVISQALTPTDQSIEVEGLGASAWAASAVAVGSEIAEPGPPAPVSAFTAAPTEPEPGAGQHRQYKVLTTKDRWFEGKFDLPRLEEALNYYASQGWVVRAMANPHVTGFSGGPREEIVILMER